ncbi:MAG: Type 1 glutamine amidotransferase-like domain-containing protein [Oscillospiraceae bacterium]|nr:Type 1 glutamine amidotransferase-like domain-containing protein [Oscillospiraceae bacterium]
MRLLLSGGGNPYQVKELDKLFAKTTNINNKILYVPIAIDTISYNDCYDWFKNTYSNYGIKNVDMITSLKNTKLDKYEAIFISGGNTFKLLKEIKESSFDTKLINYLNNGGFVYGGSAGAIIFGKTIKTAFHLDENTVGLTNFNGLNLLKGKDIWCHYEPKDNEIIKKYDNNLFILCEGAGLYIDNGKIESVGQKYLKKSGIV